MLLTTHSAGAIIKVRCNNAPTKGGSDMIERNKLRAKIVEKGTTVDDLAKRIGLCSSSFYRKMNKSSFLVREVDAIVRELNLTTDEAVAIFLTVTGA